MSQGTSNGGNNQEIIDFTQAREQRMNEKRRKTERIFFKNLIGVYSVTGHTDMQPIEIVDVSEEGCSFQVPFDKNKPWPNDLSELPIRMYFSQDTYIAIHARIQNARPSIENGTRYMRYGCTIDKTVSSYPAYSQFVKFLKAYSEHAHKDTGNATLFYL